MAKVIRNNRVTIDEKIDSLIEWRRKYPQIKIRLELKYKALREYAKNDEEYNKIKEEFDKMLKYYAYVIARKSKGYLNEEQISKCKEGNIGGVFGYPTKVEELAKKYDISEEDIDYILNKFGTIDNFYEMYHKHEIYEQKDNNLAERIIKNAIDVDNKANSGYDRLWLRLRGDYDSQSAFYSSEELKKAIDKHLTQRQKFILENRYGLVDNQKTKTLEAIGKELHITTEGIRQIELNALSKLKRKTTLNLIVRYKFDYSSEFITEEEQKEIEKIIKDTRLSNGDLYENLRKLNEFENKILERKNKGLINDSLEKNILSREIEDLEFTARTYNCLHRAGIKTIADLVEMKVEQLMKIRNLGEKSLEEILTKLHEYGIFLRQEDKDKWYESVLSLKLRDKGAQDKLHESITSLKPEDEKIIDSLLEAGIYTVDDLLKLTPKQLMQIKGICEQRLEEILKNIRQAEKNVLITRILRKQEWISHEVEKRTIEGLKGKE